jgi:branched-chain amino acid transport system ATP-binding protein
MADALLEASNIETFYGPIMAIRGVSFAVPRGSIVTILGANGAGKTTILRTVSGVMDPQKGTVIFEGTPIHGLDPDKVMRRGLAHVPEGREVFPLLTVLENLRMGAFTRSDTAGIAQDLETVYEYFPVLRARAGQRAGSLSGGEQQMLAISRALMARPKMMLLDEPSLGLAPLVCRELFRSLARIKDAGVGIFLVEQNAKQALAIADRGYLLDNGHIVGADSAASLSKDEKVRKAYLGGG